MTTTFYPGELADIYLYTKDADGLAFNPTTINQIEVLAPDRTVIETISSNWANPAIGTYKYVYNMPINLLYPFIIFRWKYTNGTYVDYEEVKAYIKGA